MVEVASEPSITPPVSRFTVSEPSTLFKAYSSKRPGFVVLPVTLILAFAPTSAVVSLAMVVVLWAALPWSTPPDPALTLFWPDGTRFFSVVFVARTWRLWVTIWA